MKERSLQDQRWMEMKRFSETHNLLLFEGRWHGRFFRQTIMSRLTLSKFLRRYDTIGLSEEGGQNDGVVYLG